MSPILVSQDDDPLVRIAAELFAKDIERVSGMRADVLGKVTSASDVVIAGTLGHSQVIDDLRMMPGLETDSN